MDAGKNVVVLYVPMPWNSPSVPRMPYPLLYLERVLRELPIELVLIDHTTTPDFRPVIDTYKDRLMLAGVSSITGFQISGGIEFSEYVKSVTTCPVIWGGWHVTMLEQEVLNESYIDFIISGQGEFPLKKLLESMLSGNSFESIPGLGYKKDGKIFYNPREEYTDPYCLPKVNFDLLDVREYIFRSPYGSRTIRYIGTQGCPNNCYFCGQNTLFRSKYYPQAVDDIIHDLKYFKEKAGINCVKFDDDNFFVNREHSLAFCKALIEEKLGINWFSIGHPRHMRNKYTEEDIALFAKAGCKMIAVGTESGDPEILKLINKATSPEDSLECIKRFHANGIRPTMTLMFAFPPNPGKDIEATQKLIAKAWRICPGLNHLISFFTPYPGTELFRLSLENGLQPPKNLSEWSNYTLKKSLSPWVKKKYARKIKLLAEYYIPMSRPGLLPRMRPLSRIMYFPWYCLTYPVVWLRFRTAYFGLPVDAHLTLAMTKTVNSITGSKFKLHHNKESIVT